MLHPLAQDGVLRLTANFDRETLADFYVRFFDRIRELDAVASRTSRRPVAQDDIERLDLPLQVGRVTLRRPCPAGVHWLTTKALTWWGESSRVYGLAAAYVMGHRGDRKALSRLYSRAWASLAVWAWACRAGASEEALRRSARALMPPPDESDKWLRPPDEPLPGAPDLAAIALGLSKHFGQTPAYWLFDVADDDFWGAVCDLQDAAEAERDAISVTKDHGHSPDSWWYRQRSALAAVERTLEAEVTQWLASRQPTNTPPEPAND